MDRDRISELPDYILHHILSFLEPPEWPDYRLEAARAACLSKSWLRVWLTYPNLTFNFNNYLTPNFDRFKRYVENTISRFSNSESMLVHSLTLVEPPSYVLPSLIRFVVEKHVKILHIDSRYCPSLLPDTIYGAKSLIELKLHCCDFCNLFPDTKIELNNLKKVICRYLDLTDQLFDKLISNCPLIEEIDLYRCILLFKRVSNVPKLKRFRMFSCCKYEMVEINAPSLESFEYFGYGTINLDACPSLKRLHLICNSKNVKNFSFSNFMYLEDPEHRSCKCPWLEKERLNISSQSLSQSLREVRFEEPDIEWVVVLDVPNLLQLHYRHGYRLNSLSFQNPETELRINVVMFTIGCESVSTWPLHFRNFFMEHSNRAKIYLSLNVKYLGRCSEIQEDSQELPKPEVEHFALNLCSTTIDHQALVNGLFWSCRPRYISVRWGGFEHLELMKYLWDNVMSRAGSVLIDCQYQQLDDAKSGSSNGVSQDAYETLYEVMEATKENEIVCFKL